MEARALRTDELPEGEARRVEIEGRAVLLVRVSGEIHALPARCPHYHGPLAKGALHGTRLVCPWHQATFDVRSGDLLEPPSFFGLPKYAVRVADGAVWVDLPDDAPTQRSLPMSACDAGKEPRVVAVIGGGAAAAAAVETLRQEGFAGRIVMLNAEDRPPYDRPNCSKDLLAGTMPATWMPLRSPRFYEKWGVELRHARVSRVHAPSRAVTLSDGQSLVPDALLIASGGVPRRPTAKGADLPGVFTLRSWDDCEAIVASLTAEARPAAAAAVIGGSFIGLETAAALTQRGVRITVIAPDTVPLRRVFGEHVGAALRALHERNGVSFRLGRTVASFAGTDRVASVELDDGSTVPTDIVVAGIGVTPATGFVEGVRLNPDGGIEVDEQLRVTGAEGVWAAGDVAHFPAAHLGGERVRIEHWRLALQHGRAAARSVVGHGAAFAGVPFFWTQQYDVRLGFVGYARPWDELIVAGDPASFEFLTFYAAGGRVHAAAGTRDQQLAAFAELMRADALPSVDRLRANPDLDLTAQLQAL